MLNRIGCRVLVKRGAAVGSALAAGGKSGCSENLTAAVRAGERKGRYPLGVVALSITLIFALSACSNPQGGSNNGANQSTDSTNSGSVQGSVKITDAPRSIEAGEQVTLHAEVEGTSQTAVWTSSDSAVALMSSSSPGRLTAQKEGTVKITATVGGLSDTITITVTKTVKVMTEKISAGHSFYRGRAWVVSAATGDLHLIDEQGNSVFSVAKNEHPGLDLVYNDSDEFFVIQKIVAVFSSDQPVIDKIVDKTGQVVFNSNSLEKETYARAFDGGYLVLYRHSTSFEENVWQIGTMDLKGNMVFEFVNLFAGSSRSPELYAMGDGLFLVSFSVGGARNAYDTSAGSYPDYYYDPRNKAIVVAEPAWYFWEDDKIFCQKDGFIYKVNRSTYALESLPIPKGERDNISYHQGVFKIFNNVRGVSTAYSERVLFRNEQGTLLLNMETVFSGKTHQTSMLSNGRCSSVVTGADGNLWVTMVDTSGSLLFDLIQVDSVHLYDSDYIIAVVAGKLSLIDSTGKIVNISLSGKVIGSGNGFDGGLAMIQLEGSSAYYIGTNGQVKIDHINIRG